MSFFVAIADDPVYLQLQFDGNEKIRLVFPVIF
jgi:hypothetical protein